MQALIRWSGFIIAAALLSGCSNFSASLSDSEMAQVTVTDNPSGKHDSGKFIWHDLLTTDVQAAGLFYEKLFAWHIEYQQEYAIVYNNGKRIAGIMKVKSSGGQEQHGIWLPSVSVADIDAAVTQVKAGGGKILKGPLDMKLRGRAVLIKDPEGAEIVLLKARGGDPQDAKAEVGDWLWNELWSHEPAKSEAFYRILLGYDTAVSKASYTVLMSHDRWRAGIRYIADDKQSMSWLPVVRVADPQAVSSRVETLGGVVWVAPDDAEGQGNTALISDPTGALLLIQRWPIATSEEEL